MDIAIIDRVASTPMDALVLPPQATEITPSASKQNEISFRLFIATRSSEIRATHTAT
jgi:hypothetical protein